MACEPILEHGWGNAVDIKEYIEQALEKIKARNEEQSEFLQAVVEVVNDLPTGDINVGSREFGYLFGQYRRLANDFSGVINGKDPEFGGCHVRLQATGFGFIHFVMEVLDGRGDSL